MVPTIQILVNGIVTGLLLSLVAIGFTYIFRVTRIFHLAHGGIYMVGACSCWWMMTVIGNWFLSCLFSFFIITLLIVLIESGVYKRLSNNLTNPTIALVASMAIYIIIINLLALLLGNQLKVFDAIFPGAFTIKYFIISKIQMLQGIVSISIIGILVIYLRTTKLNLILNSISDNETISKVVGINTNLARLKVLIVGSLLAGIAAILKTIEIGIDLKTGLNITLTSSVIAILVSRNDIFLIVIMSIIVSLLQSLSEWYLGAQWKDAITFLLLIIVILFRTEGIISYQIRKDFI